MDAVKTVPRARKDKKEIISERYEEVEKIPGGMIEDSTGLKGTMFNKVGVSVARSDKGARSTNRSNGAPRKNPHKYNMEQAGSLHRQPAHDPAPRGGRGEGGRDFFLCFIQFFDILMVTGFRVCPS